MIILDDIHNISNLDTKNNKDINIINSFDKSLLTITLPIDTEIYNSIDNNNILNIITLSKKYKKNKQNQALLPLSKEFKILNIPYNDCIKYRLLNLYSAPSSISKKLKKSLLDYIKFNIISNTTTTETSNIDNKFNNVYIFNNLVLMNIDDNGFISYYPDTMEIYDISNITKFIETEYPNINKTYLHTLENILETFEYKQINLNLNSNSYILDNLELSTININTTNNGIISTLGNIINWFNPLYYFYNTKPTTDNNINNTNIIEQTQTIPNNLCNNLDIKYYIPTYNSNSNTETANNAIHIIKLVNNKIKILRPQQMMFPIYIENITNDINENIIIKGKINNDDKYISITYNKFLHNPIVGILE
jgi:hypothetical protein